MAEKITDQLLYEKLLHAGTYIGLNVDLAEQGGSQAEYFQMLSVAKSNAIITLYWLELLNETGILPSSTYKSFVADCDELMAMISSILLTANFSNNVASDN